MTIILISGYARSGKDFTAKLLPEVFKKNTTHESMSFADDMKDIICTTFDITREHLDTYKNTGADILIDSETSLGWRKILQRFGTEAMKSVFGERVWVDRMIEKIKKSDKDVIIIPDWRFKLEYWRLLHSLFGVAEIVTVRIHNNNNPSTTSTHSSEIELDDYIDFDYNVVNDGENTEELLEQLANLSQQEGL